MFEVLHSSAGAGKTHTLVKHYLQRCLASEDPSAYGRVLALTFTNKAAGEMRERVLQYLTGLSIEGALSVQLADVRDQLKATLDLTDTQVAARATATRAHILHHWPRFAISTIDAFTKRLVTPFARDLRLDHDLRMTTEEPLYRARAVDLLLEDAGNDPELTAILTATCEHLLDEEKAWRPDTVLLALADQLGREGAINHLQLLRSVPAHRFLELHQALGQELARFRTRMRAPARAALQALHAAGIGPDDLAYGNRGIHSFLGKLARFDDHLPINSNALKSFEKDSWAKGGTGAATLQAIDQVAGLLRTAMRTYVEADEEMRLHALKVALWRDLLPTATLHELDQRLERVKHDDGVAFFSDLTRKVASIVQEEPAPFLFERLGERFDHIMVDEFQDTSVLQWHVLLPLVENALSKGGSTLLVGDAKQAIYRWRNGEARQFVHLPRLYDKGAIVDGDLREHVLVSAYRDTTPLNGNFRSGSVIIEFNNTLFEDLARSLPPEEQRVYQGHAQQPRRAFAGHVEVQCLTKEGNKEEEAPVATYIRERVREALEDGFRPCDIAVLVRSGAQGSIAAEVLVKEGLRVVAPDGLALDGDPGVRATVAIIAWMHERSDEQAAQAVQYIAMNKGEPAPFPDTRPAPERLRELLRTAPSISPRSPIGTLIVRVFGLLGIAPAGNAFAMGLQQEAHDFVTAHGDDLTGFLAHWRRKGHMRTAPTTAGPDAVRIMTVHKAKGLQFPVVIVPWTDMTARGNHEERLWVHPGGAAPGLPSALVRATSMLNDLGIPEVDTEHAQQQLDLLNLLYVAFTRPEQRLYAAVPPTGSAPLMVALREHLGLGPGQRWSSGVRGPAHVHEGEEARHWALVPRAPGQQPALTIRNDAPVEWSAEDPDPHRTRGNTLHAILAQVDAPSDLLAAIARQSAIDGIPAAEQEALRFELERVLTLPGIDRFYRDGLEAIPEATLITASGHAQRPDRIVRDEQGTRVLDIKTGTPRPEHEEQVVAYAELLTELGERRVTSHLLYLPDGHLVNVG